MPTFKELIRDKKVAEHPLLRGYRNLPNVRNNINKHAQALQEELTDLLSQGPELEDKPKNIHEMVREAAMVVQDVFSQFEIPVLPKFFYETTRDIKHARNDENRVVAGSIIFGAEFRSTLGVRKRATIPIAISAGNLIPPSVMEVDGRIYVIAQNSIDEVLERNSSFYQKPLREGYQSPPLNRFEREMAVDMRVMEGPQPRKNPGSYYMNQRNVEARRKVAVGGTPRMWKQVVEAMEKAEKDGTDTFPRSWIHVLRNYVLDFVATASKDAWEPHLINAGFCINPYGKATNRGRLRANRIAAEPMEDLITQVAQEADQEVKENHPEADFGWHGTNLAKELFPDEFYRAAVQIINELAPHYPEISEDEIFEIKGKVREIFANDRVAQSIKGDFEKEIEMEVDQDGVEQLLDEEPEAPAKEPRMYPDTKTPIEHGDGVKVRKGPGGQGFQGTIVEIDEDRDYLIIKSKGMEYRVTVDDIEPVPSTFKKMYM